MDMAPLREAFHDPRAGRTCSIGVVVADDNGGPHYEVRAGDTDIWVRVALAPSEQIAWCRLAGPWGGTSGGAPVGMFVVPLEGAEVVVLYPGGDHRADPILVAVLATGAVPSSVADVVVIPRADGVVKLGAAAGTGPVALAAATAARIAAAEFLIQHHIHPVPPTGGFSGEALTGTIPNPPIGEPGHITGTPPPTELAGPPATPPGGNIAATKVEGI